MRIASSADAITAGRLGLWLLGRRASAAAKRRLPWPHREPTCVGQKLAALIAPWRCYEYPGAAVAIASIAGCGDRAVDGWLYGRHDPGRAARERLALWLDNRGAAMVALAAELRAGNLARNVAPANKILTNGATSGPATFARAEPTRPQVNAEIFNQPQPSPRASQAAKPSKKFGTQAGRKAKRKTRR